MSKQTIALYVGLFLVVVGVFFLGTQIRTVPSVHITPERTNQVEVDRNDFESVEDAIVPVEELATPLVPYVEIIDGCELAIDYTCVRVYHEMATSSTAASQLRKGMVLRVGEVLTDEHGTTWYKIIFDEWLRYPYRVIDEWYLQHSSSTRLLYDVGPIEMSTSTEIIPSSTKKIVVDRSDQMLYAYEGDTIVIEDSISTGLLLTPTPRGTFTIYRKTPSRYMQGPIPGISTDFYDLPGVPWNLYFTYEGAVVHGAYWHNQFGKQWSHGCVNLPPARAEELYNWAEVGMVVIVQE